MNHQNSQHKNVDRIDKLGKQNYEHSLCIYSIHEFTSQETRLFVQPFVQADINENIKGPFY